MPTVLVKTLIHTGIWFITRHILQKCAYCNVFRDTLIWVGNAIVCFNVDSSLLYDVFLVYRLSPTQQYRGDIPRKRQVKFELCTLRLTGFYSRKWQPTIDIIRYLNNNSVHNTTTSKGRGTQFHVSKRNTLNSEFNNKPTIVSNGNQK